MLCDTQYGDTLATIAIWIIGGLSQARRRPGSAAVGAADNVVPGAPVSCPGPDGRVGRAIRHGQWSPERRLGSTANSPERQDDVAQRTSGDSHCARGDRIQWIRPPVDLGNVALQQRYRPKVCFAFSST